MRHLLEFLGDILAALVAVLTFLLWGWKGVFILFASCIAAIAFIWFMGDRFIAGFLCGWRKKAQ